MELLGKSKDELRDFCVALGEPAFRGIAFAILLFRSVLGRDEFRRQGQDLLVTRGDNTGAQEGVEIFRAAIGTLACRTTRAVDLARTEALGSIQRDQHPATLRATQAPEWVEHALGGDRFEEQRIERPGRGAVQHLADMGVGWNGGHANRVWQFDRPCPSVSAR